MGYCGVADGIVKVHKKLEYYIESGSEVDATPKKGFADVKTYQNSGNLRPFAMACLENRLNFLWRDNYDE